MSETIDLLIIGAGAAGLGAAQYGARANLRTVVLEELAHGGQALLIDKLENYPGLPEPVDGYTWSETMRRQAEEFGAEIRSSSVSSIRKEGGSSRSRPATASLKPRPWSWRPARSIGIWALRARRSSPAAECRTAPPATALSLRVSV